MTAEKLIAEMEVEETRYFSDTIGIYFKARSEKIDGFDYALFASLRCVPEVNHFTMEKISPYNRKDLRSFVEWALAQRNEAYWEPKLVWHKSPERN